MGASLPAQMFWFKHMKVQSGIKSRAWAGEKVATNTYAKATSKRTTGSSSPCASSVLHTLCPAPVYRTWQLTALGPITSPLQPSIDSLSPFSPLHWDL